jgi:hypothetical protein
MKQIQISIFQHSGTAAEMIADILMKPLFIETHNHHMKGMGLASE